MRRPAPAGVPVVPLSTYRVQFGPHFRFTDGERIVPYLDALGVGHLYASPYFRARPGSEHGYDIVDHNALNPEIGSAAEHRAMIDALQARGMGHLVDFVPNHMWIGPDNPWWRDVLEYGPLSPYAHFFDIDWHARSVGRGKVVLPVLGDHYGQTLERGELTVAFEHERGGFTLHSFDQRFPLAPASCAAVLAFAAGATPPETAVALRDFAAAFAALRGRPREVRKRAALRERAIELQRRLSERSAADPSLSRAVDEGCTALTAATDRLDALIAAQHYRLTFWRAAADEINYRRFFDVNDLAGLRVEDAEVLARTHELVFALIAEGQIQGLRIDHVDGLSNPGGYCNLLVDRAAALGHPLYLVVEKILAPGERLRPSWRVAGTTGYDFLNDVLGLFVDARTERAFDRIYRRVVGRQTSFAEEAYEAKRRIMRIDLASELQVLADALTRIAHRDRRSIDFTTNALRRALAEVIAAFSVYRTYVVGDVLEEDDRRTIEAAVTAARERVELADDVLFDFVRDALGAQLASIPGARYDRTDVLRFAMRFQQYTGPVTAKALEDTAFYRYSRLAALNEVGGDPAIFGRSVEAFHAANAARAASHPHAMLATATHDHKRGEDTRLRIAALTEFPTEWSRGIASWERINAAARGSEARGPAAWAEYLFYQTVVGTLPPHWLGDEPIDPAHHDAYVDRLSAYLRKALREAKLLTSWAIPNEPYEARMAAFVRSVLAADGAYFRDARRFTAALAPVAAIHGLGQTALKLTSPGVPDLYQGCELWDFSLVDPDNRRPVDYDARSAMLASFAAADAPQVLLGELLDGWPDGRIKLYLTWRLLHLRRERPGAFAGAYAPLAITGPTPDGVVAFARGGGGVVVAVPRLVRRRWTGAGLGLRAVEGERLLVGRPGARFRSVLDGRVLRTDDAGGIPTEALFASAPVAVLVSAAG